jgi:hypothetical protein
LGNYSERGHGIRRRNYLDASPCAPRGTSPRRRLLAQVLHSSGIPVHVPHDKGGISTLFRRTIALYYRISRSQRVLGRRRDCRFACRVDMNATYAELGSLFGTNSVLVCRVIDRHLASVARRANELWGPKGPWSEVNRARFRFFPNAVAAVDSTPVRVYDNRRCRYLRKALWSAKHSVPAWKLTVAVAPKGMCIWRCLLDPGGRTTSVRSTRAMLLPNFRIWRRRDQTATVRFASL